MQSHDEIVRFVTQSSQHPFLLVAKYVISVLRYGNGETSIGIRISNFLFFEYSGFNDEYTLPKI